MALKDWLKNVAPKTGKEPEPVSVSDLVALGRLDEALHALKAQIKRNPRNHHARLHMADLLFKMGKRVDAVEEYLLVAEGYAGDGFFDKAHALLAKLERLIPGDPKLTAKIERLELIQELERRRGVVTSALLNSSVSDKIGTSTYAVQQLWTNLSKCPLILQLDDQQLERLFKLVEMERWDEGEVVVKDNQPRPELMVLVRGTIAAQVLLKSGAWTDLRAFQPGDIIGEDALLQQKAWPATYAATSKATALVLGREQLEKLLIGEPDPRGLLDALREQGHDAEVAAAVAKLSQPSLPEESS